MGDRLRRVVVTGSECTGKTTLARELATHFGTSWSPEYAREYAIGTGSPLTLADVDAIARGQIAGEEEAVRRATRLVVHDTDLLSTVVYSRHYYGRCPEWVERAARDRRADLYLLLRPDVPWSPDRARDRGEQRDEMHALFKEELARSGAAYRVIGGTWTERRDHALAAVDALLRGNQRGEL
jgi:NadR type nicotinamide-nucleotide adenylyltransferase